MNQIKNTDNNLICILCNQRINKNISKHICKFRNKTRFIQLPNKFL